MKHPASLLILLLGTLACFCLSTNAEDPYLFFNWDVKYGRAAPLGTNQQVVLINGQFPGPPINGVTNDNILVNVHNHLKEPLLFTWNGVKQRRTSWQDGVEGTNCPIPPNSNWTYHFQLKDQIGTFTYFASTRLHKVAGAFGALNIDQRSVIATPYIKPQDDFTLLIGDWYKTGHRALEKRLNSGLDLPSPDGLLINGLNGKAVFTGQKGKIYKFRISNVGTKTSINFRIQGHTLTLIEVEGSHTMQESYESLDVHVGQSVCVLVTLHAQPKDYYIVASTRFSRRVLITTALLHYDGSKVPASHPLPIGPTYQIHWSMKQARTFRTNLTANAARPNPQGSFHYGTIPIVRTLVLENSAVKINGKRRYAVNGISYVNPDTPLKLADWYNIPGVFDFKTIKDRPTNAPAKFGTSVFGAALHDFVEMVFQNAEETVQSWHLDGTCFFVVGYGKGKWTENMRKRYNTVDGVERHTVQVYPRSWSAILVSLDNKGMWNCRSQDSSRRYLGQEVYIRVWNDEQSLFTESNPPDNILMCGRAKKL